MRRNFPAAVVFTALSLSAGSAAAQQLLCPPAELANCGSDLLWRDTRAAQVYFMHPLVLASRAHVDAPADPAWQLAGVAEALGDARPEILWRNAATGVAYLQSEGAEAGAQAWKVAGIGDFDGDGSVDILWRNTATGANHVYLMKGLAPVSQGELAALADQAWKVAGIGDFDGDGRADILWRHGASGANQIWLMQGVAVAAQGIVNTLPDQSWKVAAVADFNADGRADILWRYPASGSGYLYFMNGLTVTAQANLNREYAAIDVGAPTLAGQTQVVASGSAYDVTAAGRDIYARSDQFHFAHQPQSGDFDLRVRVAALSAAHPWSKAGLMARESLAPDSRGVSVLATPAGGYEFQYRAATGEFVQKLDSAARVSYPNSWVRLKRAGNEFSAYTSTDGSNWLPLGGATLALPAGVLLGMAVTSHDDRLSVLAKFRDLASHAAPPAPAPDTTPPSVPAGLVALAVSPSQVNLTWSASSDNLAVKGYKVLRGGVEVASTNATAFADTGLVPATVYGYSVAAFDAAGNTSAASTVVVVNTLPPPDVVAPSQPGGLTAAAMSGSSISLSWSAASDNTGVTGYNVRRGGTVVGGTSGLSFVDTGLSPDTRYTYSVTALDAAGNVSEPSAEAGATTGRSNFGSSLGTNLDAVKDWSRQWAFVDAFRASRAWISGSTTAWSDGSTLEMDAAGWVSSLKPGQVARTLMLWDMGAFYPAGTYVVLYDGEGSMQYGTGASLVSAQPGRAVLRVDPARGGISLTITATTPGNHVRNIRVIMPGGTCEGDPFRWAADASACADAAAYRSFEIHHASIVFHPKFLERIRGYRTLRFMDWGLTNHSAQSSWAGRPKLSDARWSEKGVPVEVMIDLANLVGADPWFNLPHLADDNYAAEYARLVKQRLRADLKAHVEYSNEVWNSIFAQASYARSRGVALALSADPFQAQLFYYSKRSVEIFDIWSAEMADPARLVRVMASQAGNSWTAEQVLDFQSARLKTDAIAIAPYFGGYLGAPSEAARVAVMTPDALFAELQSLALPRAVASIKANMAVARARALPLLAYEGGQHLAGVFGVENNAAINALFDAANRDPRMGELYTQYLDAWKASGATLFVHFNICTSFGKWGRFGALEYLEQPRAESPKFDALESFIERHPAWW